MSRPKVKIIFYCWLIYGFFYLNRLNFSPVIPLIMADLDISHARIGLIGSSFFLFYTIAQLPAGYLSDVFGARKIIFAGGLLSALANLLFSFGSGLAHLIPAQGLNGIGQGCGFSPIVKIIDQQFPISSRGRVLGLVMTSTAVFSVAAFFLAGYIGQLYGWRTVFWSASLVFVPILIVFRMGIVLPATDKTSPRDDNTEPALLNPSGKESFLELKKQLFSKNMCFLALGFFCLTYITYSNLIWLPSFLFESYDMTVAQAGLIAALYPLTGIIARPLGGYVSDVVFGGRRKQTVLIGLFVILLSTVLLSQVTLFSVNIYFIVAIGFFDNLVGPLFFAWMLDLVPYHYTGSGAGALQFVGHFGSILSIYFSGIVIDVFQSYRPFFMVLSVVSVLGIISIWMITESGERS